MGLEETIRRLGLLAQPVAETRAEGESSPPPFSLPRWCGRGWLGGGLSVAVDVHPDELIGPLCSGVGRPASALKVLDVRERPEPELSVWFEGSTLQWPLSDSRALVRQMNELFSGRDSARAIVVLGEWEEALQLWFLKKFHLRLLLNESQFSPENRNELEALESGTSEGI